MGESKKEDRQQKPVFLYLLQTANKNTYTKSILRHFLANSSNFLHLVDKILSPSQNNALNGFKMSRFIFN